MCISILGTCVVAGLLSAGVDHVSFNKTAHSYDGEARDISQFYTPSNNVYHGTVGIFADDWSAKIKYDNGFESDKLSISKSTTIQLSKNFELNESWSIKGSVGFQLGGQSKHKPCTDETDRKYYCGNLTAWSDFKEPDYNPYRSVNIKLTKTF